MSLTARSGSDVEGTDRLVGELSQLGALAFLFGDPGDKYSAVDVRFDGGKHQAPELGGVDRLDLPLNGPGGVEVVLVAERGPAGIVGLFAPGRQPTLKTRSE
ncbi:hypothetical protein ACI1MP_37140 (plasmid) [Kitasatospora griseola]|uniref:hypothetical protein n=1 Tax=Kitasatospora griseola TaxID=2064 RepID=UPI003855EB07